MDLAIDLAGNVATVRPRGAVDVAGARELDESLARLVRRRGIERVTVDLGDVDHLGAAAVVALGLARERAGQRGVDFQLDRVGDRHRAVFEQLPAAPPEPPPPRSASALERLGAAGYAGLARTRALGRMIAASARGVLDCATGRSRLPHGSLAEHAVRVGVDALPIVALLSLLLGVVLALESGTQLRRFGAELYLADVLGLAVIREFGPLLTAIILAGRSGSSFAAELGTMVVREEIAALRTMGISPERYLVLPRLLAILIVGPALAVLACAVAIAGGALICDTVGLPAEAYWERLLGAVRGRDIAVGLIKSVVFSAIVGLIGCFTGILTRGAGTGVGRSTTRAVVVSIVLIVITDSLITTASTVWGNG